MMNDDPRETQQELFEEFSTAPKKPERFPSIAKTQKPILISTTLEQLLMIGIISVLVFCGVFFLGVLRGKSLTHPILSPSRTVFVQPQAQNALVAASPMRTAPVAQSAPAAAVRVTSPMASVADKPYTIQVVTQRRQDLADQEVAKLRRMGYVSFIVPSGEYYQVCAGQYTNKEEARRDLSFFSSKYKDCFLRRRPVA